MDRRDLVYCVRCGIKAGNGAIFNRVKKVEGCLIWQGGTKMGVPIIQIDGKEHPVKNVAYYMWHQRKHEGHIKQACSDPLCVNPEHLIDKHVRKLTKAGWPLNEVVNAIE